MSEIENVAIYREAIEKWGANIQLLMAMEEASELAVAISHFIRDRKGAIDEIIEETADMEIMIEQIKTIFEEENIVEKMEEIKKQKINRLKAILETGNEDIR